MKKLILYSIVFSFLLMACESNRDGFSSRPVRSLLHPEPELLDVDAVVFHLNDSVTRIFLKVGNDRLLYKRPDSSKVFYAQLKISFLLVPVEHPRILADSASRLFLHPSESENVSFEYLHTYIDVKARHEINYDVEITLWDIHRRTKYKKALSVIKENRFGAQNFLITKNDSVSFRNWFVKGETAKLKYTYQQDELLTVEWFRQQQGPALPPFSARTQEEVRPKMDSISELDVSNNMAGLLVPEKGFLFIKASRGNSEGVCLYTVDESFPGVNSSKEMIQCTRYIMSRDEYEHCLEAIDQKAAIDEFWLNIGGSRERARELLKRYYTRVLEANKNYSSYIPGWKSDRGMIYVVMGNPAKIFKSRDVETWLYGTEASANALRFVFVKAPRALCENDLVLERSGFYRDPYHGAVEFWRQGVVYNDNNH